MARLFVQHLTVIDCSLLDAARGLLGDSWIVDLELGGSLDDQGMILDFGELKRSLKDLIDGEVDHRLLVPQRSPALQIDDGTRAHLRYRTADDRLIELWSPRRALCLLPVAEVDLAAARAHLTESLRRAVPQNVDHVELTLRREQIGGAHYQYSHGLKKHAGACQRIAHGHRSRIEIFENQRRSDEWERYWSARWRDIYLASEEDRVEAVPPGRLRFSYDAPEGRFSLEMDADRCYLLASETTVECIAEHIAAELGRLRPQSSFTVRAFEGVNKGAIAHFP